jgi:hypothetical protein
MADHTSDTIGAVPVRADRSPTVSVEPRVESRSVLLVEQTLQQRILSVGASWQTAQYALVTLVAELDATDGWTDQGVPTCAHWVSRALDIEVSTAREWLRVGRALVDLPFLGACFEAGLSYSKVRTLTRVATRENERDLVELARRTPAGRLGMVLATWLMQREDPEVTHRRQHAARSLSWRVEPDGMVHGAFRLPPVIGKQLTSVIDSLVKRSHGAAVDDASADASPSRWPSIAQQRADAMSRLVTKGGTGVATEIVINIRGDGATFDDGTPIPWPELERIAPESYVRALIHDADGRPINASSRQRHPSVRQQRVVTARDRCCVDCGGTEFLEFDHEPAFEKTHRTVVEELKLRCWPCHRLRHGDDADRRRSGGGDRE